MKIPSSHYQRRARLEIIPLIDVVFFLLAAFVLVSVSLNKESGVPVNVAKATTSVSTIGDNQIVISVKADGALYVEKEKVALPDMVKRLRAAKAKDPSVVVVINSDAASRFGDSVIILDKIRYIGIQQVYIRTK